MGSGGGYYSGVEVIDGQVFVSAPGTFLPGLVLRFDGASWSGTEIPEINALAATSPQRVLAVGAGGGAYHYDGAVWLAGRTGGGTALSQVFASPGGSSYAVGTGGSVLRFDGAFAVARSVPQWRIADLWAVPGTNQIYGAIFHYDGNQWLPMRSATTSSIHAIHATSRRIIGPGDFGSLTEVRRDQFWHCPTTERLCGDGIDNDCDDLVDAKDPDCP